MKRIPNRKISCKSLIDNIIWIKYGSENRKNALSRIFVRKNGNLNNDAEPCFRLYVPPH